MHNPDGKYNNTFVRGDHIEIRAGYEGSEGTDFGLQTIFVGVIRNVTINYSDSMGEVITLEGSDYENVLHNKSMEHIIRRTDIDGRGTHLARDLIKELNSMFTTEFGYSDVPFYYKQIGSSGTREKVDIIKKYMQTDAAAEQPIVDLGLRHLVKDQRPQSINLSMDNPMYDEKVWSYFKKTFEDSGLHVRLKTKSQHGVTFARGSPQLILSPMNVMTSEMNEFVERVSNPHDFIYSDISTLRKPHLYRPNIESIKLFEDSANIKNRVVVRLILPKIIVTVGNTGRKKRFVGTNIVTLDSDKLLFPERYRKYKKKSSRSFFISKKRGEYVYNIATGEKNGKTTYTEINTSLGTFENEDGEKRETTIENIEIDMRGKNPVTLKNMVDIHQRFFGKRTKMIVKDSLVYLNKSLDEKNRIVWGERYYRRMGSINYGKIITQCIKDIAKVLVEHVHAVKGKITLSHGNPSIDVFDCCRVMDKRSLIKSKASGSGSETTAFVQNAIGEIKKKRFLDKIIPFDLAPTDSVGQLLQEFRVSSTDKTITTTAGTTVRNQSDLLHDGVPLDRRYIITYVNHIITADGFNTTVNFQFVPTYYTSEIMDEFLRDAYNIGDSARREINQQVINKGYRAAVGTVVSSMKLPNEPKNFDYLKYMREFEGDTEGLAGYPSQDAEEYKNAYFDRMLVKISDGDIVAATVLRQKYIFAPIKVDDMVAMIKLSDGTTENDLQESSNWVIIGVLETGSSLKYAMSKEPFVIKTGERGLTEENIIYDKNYKTGFDSNIDLSPSEQKSQQAFIISMNDFTVFSPTSGHQSDESTKPAKNNKVVFESNSKRDFTGGARHQKASFNLNSYQAPVDSLESGESIIELAVYEVNDDGWASTTRPYAYMFMEQQDASSEARNSRIQLRTKGSKDSTTTQTQLILQGDGKLELLATETVDIQAKQVWLHGSDMTIIGNTSETGTEIIALDKDDIAIDSGLDTLLTTILDALSAIGQAGALQVIDPISGVLPSAPATYGVYMGLLQIAEQSYNLSKTTNSGKQKIGEIVVNSASRKIKGKT